MKKNNKNMVYLLLPMVIIIWGVIFYKILGNDSPEKMNFTPTLASPDPVKEDTPEITDFQLELDYEDPFLGGRPIKKVAIAGGQQLESQSDQQVINWPAVFYQGCISNEKGTLARLNVNDQVYLTGLEALPVEIEVMKITPDSILLKYQREKKWFLK